MAVLFREHDEVRLLRRLTALVADELNPQELDQLAAGDLDVIKKTTRRAKRAVAPLIRPDSVPRAVLEKLVGESLDLVPVWYLDAARQAARAVCRIITPQREPRGSGVMVSPRLLLTNNHVISGPEEATQRWMQADYELDSSGGEKPTTVFGLDPDAFFWTSAANELDFTLVAVGETRFGKGRLADLGVCPMSASEHKHAAGDHVTVVQHPDGGFKQVGLRDNQVIGRGQGGVTLHYATDTLPGSSGSPVFNDQFELVALHHAGGPVIETTLDSGEAVPTESNEGIRISRILLELEAQKSRLKDFAGDLLAAAIPAAE